MAFIDTHLEGLRLVVYIAGSVVRIEHPLEEKVSGFFQNKTQSVKCPISVVYIRAGKPKKIPPLTGC
jgi:hypothetical protein